MVVTKGYRIIEPRKNSTIAKLSGIQHEIIWFFQSVFTRNQEITSLPDIGYFENNSSGSQQHDTYVVICIQLLVCRAVAEICIVNVRLHIFNNFLVIWDKVALDESEIVHRLTQNTRNTVLLDTEYFENRVPKRLQNLILYLATSQ